MGSSGVVTLVIVAMWSAYLVPMWLRRHDLTNESRSVDRFSRAMRTLSRRTPTPDRRYVVRPVAPTGPSSAMATRRRRVLALLLLVTLVAVTASLLGKVSWLASGAAAVLFAAYVAHLRAQTRVAREVARRRLQTERRVVARARRELTVPAQARARRAVMAPAERAPEMVSAGGVRFEEDPLEAVLDLAVDDSWHPVPVPLPTYVTAPKAVRPVKVARSSRVIDLTSPGAWSEGQRVDEPVPVVPAFSLSFARLTGADPSGEESWSEAMGDTRGTWAHEVDAEESYRQQRAVGD